MLFSMYSRNFTSKLLSFLPTLFSQIENYLSHLYSSVSLRWRCKITSAGTSSASGNRSRHLEFEATIGDELENDSPSRKRIFQRASAVDVRHSRHSARPTSATTGAAAAELL